MASVFLDPNEDQYSDSSGMATTGSTYWEVLDDGVRSPTAPSTASDYVVASSSFAYFDTGGLQIGFTDVVIPVNATGLRMWAYCRRISGSPQTFGVQEVGVGLGSPSNNPFVTTTAGWTTCDWESVDLTPGQVLDLSLFLTPETLPSGTIRIFALYLEITYPGGDNTADDFFLMF